ncbi:MAG TPA: sulfate adenylyltransferase [Gammaproteobacteria bacterium]|nr:sulfate adenylyltransferase [Gammaproteobacteria bacterium]
MRRPWRLLPLLLLLAAWVGSQSQLLVFTPTLYEWVEQKYGSAARERVERLEALVEDNLDAPEREKIRLVNRFFNQVRYDEDDVLWDQKDYWATPFEVLGLNAADCEDYALSKYFALVSMGVAEEKLRVTYVKAIKLKRAHMVLAYYPTPGAEPLILDNLSDRIQKAGRRTDLVPVYSFNGADLWLAVNRTKGKKVGSAERIKRWQAFQVRLAQQMGEEP